VLQTGNYRELAGRPVGIFHYQSIDSRRVRWESRYSSLRAPLDEAILEEDRELVNRCLLVCRATPIGRDISQRQPEQLGRRFIAGELLAGPHGGSLVRDADYECEIRNLERKHPSRVFFLQDDRMKATPKARTAMQTAISRGLISISSVMTTLLQR